MLWLREGDSNMKIFHWMANSNRRNNNIGGLNIDGVMTLDREVIEEGVFTRKISSFVLIWKH